MADMFTPLKAVLGDRTADVFAKALDLHTVGQLLRHYPRRYGKRSELTDVYGLPDGEHVTVVGLVTKVETRPMRQRKGSLRHVTLDIGGGSLSITFFSKSAKWAPGHQLAVGARGLFAGKLSTFQGVRQLAHPDYKLLEDYEPDMPGGEKFATGIIPIYPATASLATWTIAQSVAVVLDSLDEPADPLPADLRHQRGLLTLAQALEGVHRPIDWDELNAARDRLKWDEAYVLQVTLAQRRNNLERSPATPCTPGALVRGFDERLPFSLTQGQLAVADEITADLARSHPMHRLLQGEVGSGKTVLAVRAMLAVVDSGGQAALLAPTEVLAVQHFRAITQLLGPLAQRGQLGGADASTRVTLLTGSQTAAQRRAALLEAASGEAGIVVGTHALIQDVVQFAELGMVVVDEQHRFGVHQRDALRAKAGWIAPHLLVMTATPIPRTVAMTVFGDLDVSELRELPKGRSPIQTFVIPPEHPKYGARMWGRLRDEVAAGRQAFVVCARIGDTETKKTDDEPVEPAGAAAKEERTPAAAVIDVLPLLAEGELAGLRVAALHGRMSGDDKDAVMQAFARGELDVLVATTVIEVGVDVPNASVMVVLDADRFGISQLHQLRGRVGRGSAQGWCFLQTNAPVSSPSRERLAAVAATLDGFDLARVDLELRREGDVLGASQSGRGSLHFLRLTEDLETITDARAEATKLIAADPTLADHPALAEAISASLDDERAEYLDRA